MHPLGRKATVGFDFSFYPRLCGAGQWQQTTSPSQLYRCVDQCSMLYDVAKPFRYAKVFTYVSYIRGILGFLYCCFIVELNWYNLVLS